MLRMNWACTINLRVASACASLSNTWWIHKVDKKKWTLSHVITTIIHFHTGTNWIYHHFHLKFRYNLINVPFFKVEKNQKAKFPRYFINFFIKTKTIMYIGCTSMFINKLWSCSLSNQSVEQKHNNWLLCLPFKQEFNS